MTTLNKSVLSPDIVGHVGPALIRKYQTTDESLTEHISLDAFSMH